MIQTTEYEKIPATIMRRTTGKIDADEMKCGIVEANDIINKIILIHDRFNLIIDPRGHNFTDLSVHKTWKMWLKSEPIKEKASYVALIVDDSPHTRAEKELMETDRLKFFFDFDDAVNWLKFRPL